MISFNDCDVFINGTGLMADSASISEQNSLSPMVGVGWSNPKKIPTGPVLTNIQISYIPTIENDINFLIIQDIKRLIPVIKCVEIEIAGMQSSGYLTSFSLNVSPNEPATATANYLSYHKLIGTIGPKKGFVSYNLNPDDKPHGWVTIVNYQNSLSDTYSFSYQLDLEYKPVYILGQKTPQEIVFIGGTEKVKVTKDTFIAPDYSGYFGIRDLFPTTQESIVLYNLNQNWQPDRTTAITFDLRDAQISESQINASLDQYVGVDITAERNF